MVCQRCSRPTANLLPVDGDDPGVPGAALTMTGGRWPRLESRGGERRATLWLSRAGSGRVRAAHGCQGQRMQRRAIDPDADLAASEDPRGQDHLPAERDGPGPGHRPFHLDHFVLARGGGPAGRAPSAVSRARSMTLRCEDGLDPGAADRQGGPGGSRPRTARAGRHGPVRARTAARPAICSPTPGPPYLFSSGNLPGLGPAGVVPVGGHLETHAHQRNGVADGAASRLDRVREVWR